MTIKNSNVLNVIFVLCFLSDELSPEGAPIQKQSFPKKHYKAAVSLKKKIVGMLEYKVGEEWKKELQPLEKSEQQRIVAGEFELSDSEKEFVKQCVKEAEEFPTMSEDEYAEFVEILGADPLA